MFVPASARCEFLQFAYCRQFRSRFPLESGKGRPEDIETPDLSSVFDESSTPAIWLIHRNAQLPRISDCPFDKATHQRTNPPIVPSLPRSRRETVLSRPADSHISSGNN